MTDRLAELGALQYAVENLSTAGTNPNRLGLAGYIHAAYTDYQTWAAANPGVNPNRLSARGRLYGYFYDNASNPDAVIEALFANSEQGAWYDPSDLSSMFQDSAGTTPVTAAGQNVLRINDKSGNGNDIIFTGGIPLAQNPLGIYYLQGNGFYGSTASAVNLSSFNKISIICGSKAGTVGQSIFKFGSISSDAGSFDLGTITDKKPLLYWRGSTGFAAKYYGNDIQNELVVSTQIDLTGTNQATECPVFLINGNDVSTVTVNNDGGSGPLGNFVFGLFYGYSPIFQGRFYGLVAVTGLLDAATNLSAETWMAQKTGIDITQNPLYYEIVPTSFTDSLAPIDKTTYYETSPFAQVVFDTTATEIEVIAECNIASLFLDAAEIGVYVDGVFNSGIQQGGDGVNANRFTLSAGSKRVSIVNGAQSQLSPIKGTFVNMIHANAAMTQVFPTVTDRIYIYGDSIAVGANSVYSQQNAWSMQLRRYRGTDSTMVDAQGYRALSTDASDGTARTAFVAKVVSANPAKLWMAIGTNDYGIPTTNAADFGSDYAALLDALHTALPSMVIYCQTPIVRTSEVANSFGNTLGDYRSQISTAVSTRTAYCTLVDGTSLVTTSDLHDGVHPTDAGHGIYYAAVKTVLGI
jgi:lysophospholipase L1-like esterase